MIVAVISYADVLGCVMLVSSQYYLHCKLTNVKFIDVISPGLVLAATLRRRSRTSSSSPANMRSEVAVATSEGAAATSVLAKRFMPTVVRIGGWYIWLDLLGPCRNDTIVVGQAFVDVDGGFAELGAQVVHT